MNDRANLSNSSTRASQAGLAISKGCNVARSCCSRSHTETAEQPKSAAKECCCRHSKAGNYRGVTPANLKPLTKPSSTITQQQLCRCPLPICCRPAAAAESDCLSTPSPTINSTAAIPLHLELARCRTVAAAACVGILDSVAISSSSCRYQHRSGSLCARR